MTAAGCTRSLVEIDAGQIEGGDFQVADFAERSPNISHNLPPKFNIQVTTREHSIAVPRHVLAENGQSFRHLLHNPTLK